MTEITLQEPPIQLQEEEVVQTVSLTEDEVTPTTVTSPEVAANRAREYDFALKERSPGEDVLTQDILNGREDIERHGAVADEFSKSAQTVQEMQTEKILTRPVSKGPVTQQEVQELQSLRPTPGADYSTILERKYSRRVLDEVLTRTSEGAFESAFEADSNTTVEAIDAAENIMTLRKGTQKLLEDAEAQYNESSFGEKVLNNGLLMVPFYQTIKLGSELEEVVQSSILPGSNLAEKVAVLRTLPAEEALALIKRAGESLAADNPLNALKFYSAIMGQTANEQFLDDVFLPLDAVGVGTGATATAIGRALSSGLKATVRSGTQRIVNPTRVLGHSGATADAAHLEAVNKVFLRGQETGSIDQTAELVSEMPSIFNPRHWFDGPQHGMTQEMVNRLVFDAKTSNAEMLSLFTDQNLIKRLNSDDLLQAGVRASREKMNFQYPDAVDGMIDSELILAENTLENVDSVRHIFGKNTGELFDSEQQAQVWANLMYKFKKGTYEIAPFGDNKFRIEFAKNIEETSEGVRNQLVIETDGATPQSIASTYLQIATSNVDKVSPEQHQRLLQGVVGGSNAVNIMREQVRAIGKLRKDSAQNMNAFIDRQRVAPNARTGQRGQFSHSVADFQSEWMAQFGRRADEKEVQHYWAYIRMNELDYGIRNLVETTRQARAGVEQHFVGLGNGRTSKPIEGNSIRELPSFGNQRAQVLVLGSTPADNRVLTLRQAREEGLDQGGQNKIIQPTKYAQPKLADDPDLAPILPNGRVSFIVAPDIKSGKLPYKRFERVDGGHFQYEDQFSVVQPDIRPNSVGDSFSYISDNIFRSVRTQREGQIVANAMERGRVLLNDVYAGRSGALREFADHVSGTLPISPTEFRRLFRSPNGRDGKYSLDVPFVVQARGQRGLDALPRDQVERFPNVRESIDDFDVLQNDGVEFTGQRDGPMMAARVEGSRGNPTINFQETPMLSIDDSLNASATRLLEGRFLEDVKMTSAEDFVAEFLDTIDLTQYRNGIREIQANPWKALVDGKFKADFPDAARLKAAENHRRSVMELLNVKSREQKDTDSLLQGLMDNLGVDPDSRLRDPKVLSQIKDPSSFFRNIAFHKTLGVWNPRQLVLQAMGSVHVFAVEGPARAGKALGGVVPMMSLRFNSNPAIVERAAEIASNMGFGTKEHFKEAYDGLMSTGFQHIGNEQVIKGDFLNESIVEGKVSKFFDAGTVFFKKGEEFTRTLAWNTAYRRWREANPTAKFDGRATDEVLARADLLSVNMTKASQAQWQTGLLSIPTQFFSYPARLAEQFMGRRLTTQEKARAFATYSMMFGVPTGVAATTYGAIPAGFWPVGESIRKGLLEQGIDPDSPAVNAILEGIPATTIEFLKGDQTNISENFSPGMNILKDILYDEKSMIDIFSGVSGSVIGDLVKTTEPFIGFITAPITGNDIPLDRDDILGILDNVSSLSNLKKAIIAINTGEIVDKKGSVLQKDVDNMDASLIFLLGLQTSDISDAFLMLESESERKAFEFEMTQKAQNSYKKAMIATRDGDEDEATLQMKRMEAFFKAGGVNTLDRGRAISRFLRENKSLVESAEAKFYAMPRDRQELYLKRLERRN
jgi:hypothetical protein